MEERETPILAYPRFQGDPAGAVWDAARDCSAIVFLQKSNEKKVDEREGLAYNEVEFSTPSLRVLIILYCILTRRLTTMKLRPLSDRIVVKPIEREAKTASGIILPESAREKPQEGEVIAVGPGARNDKGEFMPLDIKVGDIVLYAKYAGTEVKLDEEKLLILRESDILAVVEEE